ncbi:SDR family NAD(P)-dependent oxidoreductase, partial [Lacticaseibacillus paracasei]
MGESLAMRCAAAGMTVVLATRNAQRLDPLIAEIHRSGGQAHSYSCDATSEVSVTSLLNRIDEEFGAPALVVYSLQWFEKV